MVQYQTWLNNNNKNSEFDWNIIQLIKRKKKKKRHLTALLLRDRKDVLKQEAETKTNRFLAYTQTTKQSFLKIFTRDRKAKLKKIPTYSCTRPPHGSIFLQFGVAVNQYVLIKAESRDRVKHGGCAPASIDDPTNY